MRESKKKILRKSDLIYVIEGKLKEVWCVKLRKYVKEELLC